MGWPSNPSELLGSDGHRIHPDHYLQAYLMSIWTRTGLPLREIPYPRLKQPPHYEVSHGSYVDTDHTPVEHWPRFLLRNFLFVRDKLKKGKVSDETLRRCVKECIRQEEMDPFVEAAVIRADVGEGDEPFSHKLDIDKIRKAQEDVLNDVGGPSESLKSKLEQLKMHERIHKLYDSEKLSRKTSMSHYLYKTAAARRRWIAQIEEIVAHLGLDPDEVTIIYIPVRLGKIPPGYYILADRGFSSCAPSYPFLNGQITPFFLAGRDQFEEAEISADRTKCKLRYGSETKFSQVTDYTALKDRIPRSFFCHPHEICDFAHGASNFCEPFYLPYDEEDDYFADIRKSREQTRRDAAERLEACKRKREGA